MPLKIEIPKKNNLNNIFNVFWCNLIQVPETILINDSNSEIWKIYNQTFLNFFNAFFHDDIGFVLCEI